MPFVQKFDKEEVLRLRKQGVPRSKIAAVLKCGLGTVHRILAELKFRERNRTPLTKQEEDRVLTEYAAGKSGMKIAKELNREFKVVYRFLERVGTERRNPSDCKRVYKLNQDAFKDAENDSEVAYWVGFLMADGCVMIRKSGQQVVSLGLSSKDGEHVCKFRDFLQSDMPIGNYENHGYKGSERTTHLSVTSKTMVNDLAKYGITPRKSMTAEVKLLENNRHFWRGMVDGDGWITMRKGKIPGIGFTGGERIIEQFRDFVHAVVGKRPNRNKNHSIWSVAITGRKAIKLIKKLYGGKGLTKLNRKFITAKEAVQWVSKKADRSTISNEKIEELKVELGTWKAVASSLNIGYNALIQLRHHRRQVKG